MLRGKMFEYFMLSNEMDSKLSIHIGCKLKGKINKIEQNKIIYHTSYQTKY